MARVFLPATMRSLVDDREMVEVAGNTVRELIDELEQRFPGVRDGLCRDDGLRPDVAVAVDGSISQLGVLQRVPPDCEVHFLPAIGGG